MISPNGLEELADLVEQGWQEASFCCGLVWRLLLYSILPCQRLKRPIQSLLLYESTEMNT